MKLFTALVVSLLTVFNSWGAGIQKKQLITITVTGVPVAEKFRLDNVYQVSEEGTILLLKLGQVEASGKSYRKLAEDLATLYRKGERGSNPTFMVTSTPPGCGVKVFVVGGEVKTPGPKPYFEGITLVNAIACAGGISKSRDRKVIKIYRNGKAYTYGADDLERLTKIKVREDDLIDVRVLENE